MSLATLYSIGDTLRPGPKLFVAKSEDGVYTGRLTFTCQKFKLFLPANQALLEKGTPITDLYPEASDYSFLTVKDWDAQDEPGGITEVTVNFTGIDFIGNSDDSFDDNKNVSYTRTDSYKEEPIWSHPKLIQELQGSQIESLKLCVEGKARLEGGLFLYWSNDGFAGSYSESMADWYELIVQQGKVTYHQPVSEWTKSSTGKGTLPDSICDKIGKKDDPDGDPAPPKDQVWILSGATENIPVVGTGVNSYTLTWTSGNFDNTIYEG